MPQIVIYKKLNFWEEYTPLAVIKGSSKANKTQEINIKQTSYTAKIF